MEGQILLGIIGAFIGLICASLYWALQQLIPLSSLSGDQVVAFSVIGAIGLVAFVDALYLWSEWR